jgi:hypothetical protein
MLSLAIAANFMIICERITLVFRAEFCLRKSQYKFSSKSNYTKILCIQKNIKKAKKKIEIR